MLFSSANPSLSSVMTEAMRRFDEWVASNGAKAIHASLRGPVWSTAVIKDPVRAVEVLKKEWLETKSVDGKIISLSAMARVHDPELINTTILPFNFGKASDCVPAADMHVLGRGLADQPVGRKLQWQYLQHNWDACSSKLGNPIVVDRFISTSLNRFTDASDVEDIDLFFKDKDTHSFDRTLRTVKDTVLARAAYKKRDQASLREWLRAHHYN